MNGKHTCAETNMCINTPVHKQKMGGIQNVIFLVDKYLLLKWRTLGLLKKHLCTEYIFV